MSYDGQIPLDVLNGKTPEVCIYMIRYYCMVGVSPCPGKPAIYDCDHAFFQPRLNRVQNERKSQIKCKEQRNEHRNSNTGEKWGSNQKNS